MKYYFLAISMLFSITVLAQQKTIRVVTNGDKPVQNATVKISASNSIITDNDGNFTVDCKKVKQVRISHIGFETKNIFINNCDNETVFLPIAENVLSNVEITATSAENKSLLSQPASITKIGNTEIHRGLGLYLDDAVNGNIPGVTMTRRAVSSGQQINIRGYGSGLGFKGPSNNFDAQGVKVYLNGIPITDAEGITVMDDIDFASIGNVEVTKGPSGSLYGFAVAGVVNLKTIQPPMGTSIGQEVTIGNYGLQRYTTRLQMGYKHSSMLVTYGHQKSDGYLVHNASKKDFVNVAGDFTPNDKQDISVYFGYSNSYDERAGELTIEQYENKDYSGNARYIKNNAHSAIIGFRAGASHTYKFNPNINNVTTVFGAAYTNNSSSAAGRTDKDPVNFGLRSTFHTVFNPSENISLSGVTGVETQTQKAQTIGYGMVANPNDANGYNILGAMKSNQFTTTAFTSMFTEWTATFPQQLSVTAGVSMSDQKITLEDRFYNPATAGGKKTFSNTFNGLFAPHIAVNKIFNQKISIYASYSVAYKPPVASLFFIPSTGELNKGLVPERGEQFEIGTKGALMNGKLVYQLAAFNAFFKNKFYAVAVPLDANTTAYSYTANGGKLDNKGIEGLLKFTALESSTGFFKTIRPFFNFTYSDYHYRDYEFQSLSSDKKDVVINNYDGNKVPGVAPFVFNAGADMNSNTGLYANLMFNYRDGFFITSDNKFSTKSYSLLNGKIGFQRDLSQHFNVDLYFGVNNITGTQYPLMVFIDQLADAYIPGPLDPNYYGGINLKYRF